MLADCLQFMQKYFILFYHTELPMFTSIRPGTSRMRLENGSKIFKFKVRLGSNCFPK